jgi:molybdate transport system ATP-binding protein
MRKQFRNADQKFHLDVEFRVAPGFSILFGASGAGKTTIFNAIAGLMDPEEGRIALGDLVLFDSAQRKRVPAWQRNIGYVLQDLALFPHLTAEENVGYGLRTLPALERNRRSREMLATFRVDHLRDRRPAEISGGERQRVALARTLVMEPRALLLDEPLAALDRPTKSLIIEDLRQWNQSRRIPILYVTHSGEEVFALGDQVIVLDAGKVIAQGLPHEVMRAPRLETVAQLLGFENIFDAGVVAIHEDRGTMTCRVENSTLELETPLVRAETGSRLRVGIRAGDLLLAIENPRGLSARNVLPGKITGIEQRDRLALVKTNCSGVAFEANLTLAAREALGLSIGKDVWVVVKTHSCHLMST